MLTHKLIPSAWKCGSRLALDHVNHTPVATSNRTKYSHRNNRPITHMSLIYDKIGHCWMIRKTASTDSAATIYCAAAIYFASRGEEHRQFTGYKRASCDSRWERRRCEIQASGRRFWSIFCAHTLSTKSRQSRRYNGLTFSLLLDNNRKRPKRRLLKYRKYSRCPRYHEPKNTHLGSRKRIRRGKVNNRTVACVRSRELESTD